MKVLLEKGYSRIAQIISGIIPSVKTIGIVTWENPMNTPLSATENNKRNKKLADTLKRGAYSYRHIKGKYGVYENPFMVHNISKLDIIELGNLGKQESVIYGHFESTGGMTFDLIDCNSGSIISTRKIWKGLDRGEVDYYSEFKGRKFIIPFFDEDSINKHFERGKIVSDYNVYNEGKYPPSVRSMVNEVYSKNNGSYTSRIAAFEILYRYEKEKISSKPKL